MNHTSQGLTAHKAVQSFLQAKPAEALSRRTIAGYADTLNQWLEYTGQVEVCKITAPNIRAYLAYLRTEYQPRRITGKTHPLSPKTPRNVYITLASYFAWLSVEFGLESSLKPIPTPKFRSWRSSPSPSRRSGPFRF